MFPTERRDPDGRVWRRRKELSTTGALLRLDHASGHVSNSNLEFSDWLQELLEAIPEGDYRDAAAMRLSVLDPKASEPASSLPKIFWDKAQAEQLQGAAYQKAYASVMTKIVCADEVPYYAVRSVIE